MTGQHSGNIEASPELRQKSGWHGLGQHGGIELGSLNHEVNRSEADRRSQSWLTGCLLSLNTLHDEQAYFSHQISKSLTLQSRGKQRVPLQRSSCLDLL